MQLEKLPTRQELMQELAQPVDQEYLMRLGEEQHERLRVSVDRFNFGVAVTGPITCMGPEKCPFVRFCPFTRFGDDGKMRFESRKNYPIGGGCVMESLFVQQKLLDYMRHMHISPDNPVEMGIANELALIELYKRRAQMFMGRNDDNIQGLDFLIRDEFVDSETGAVSFTTKLHPLVEFMDKLEKRKSGWLEKLLQTRSAKAKLAAKLAEKSESQMLTNLRQLKEIMHKLDSDDAVLEVPLD